MQYYIINNRCTPKAFKRASHHIEPLLIQTIMTKGRQIFPLSRNKRATKHDS